MNKLPERRPAGLYIRFTWEGFGLTLAVIGALGLMSVIGGGDMSGRSGHNWSLPVVLLIVSVALLALGGWIAWWADREAKARVLRANRQPQLYTVRIGRDGIRLSASPRRVATAMRSHLDDSLCSDG